jgi:hypothetical protein
VQVVGLLRHVPAGEQLPVVLLEPKQGSGRVAVWVSDQGKSGLFDASGQPRPAVAKLLEAGVAVVGADLLYQGEFLPPGETFDTTPRVDNPREAAAYTFGYNHSVFAGRVHDVLTLVAFARQRACGGTSRSDRAGRRRRVGSRRAGSGRRCGRASGSGFPEGSGLPRSIRSTRPISSRAAPSTSICPGCWRLHHARCGWPARPAKRPPWWSSQRQEAKDAVEAQCEEAARSGQFQRMQQFPVLWDAKNGLLYCGGTSASASEVCSDLMLKAFELEMRRLTSGRLAIEWSTKARQRGALNSAAPADFHGDSHSADVAWWDGDKDNYDFLGNEFLLWLWWHWETQGDTIGLADGSEVTGMFARTLMLECPRGESGKGTIAAEDPTQLPEAAQAIRSGKLPRKAGLILVRHGTQCELTLQAETFAVSGAKIQVDEDAEGRAVLEDRIEGLRGLKETLDLLFQAFCQRRTGNVWSSDLGQIRTWLKAKPRPRRT